MAAAGVDASNIDAGHACVLLPARPRRLGPRAARRRCASAPARNVARAWSPTPPAGPGATGQTDIAIGAAGLARARRPTPAAPTRTATRSRSPRRRSPTSSPAPPTWSRASSAGRPFAVVRGLRRPGAARRRARPRRRGAGPRRGAGHVRARRPRGGGRAPCAATTTRAASAPPCTAAELAGAALRARRHTADVRVDGDGAVVTARLAGTEREQGAADARLAAARVRARLADPDDGRRAGSAGVLRLRRRHSVDSRRRARPRTAHEPETAGTRPWPRSRQGPTAARSSSRCARTRRRPSAAATIVVVSACVVVGAADRRAPRPSRRSSRLAGPRGDLANLGASDVGRRLPARSQTKKADGNQDHEPQGTPITYADAPPAFGPHYAVTGAVRAQVLHRRRPPRARVRSCTTSSTATRCSGTTTRSPRTPTSSPSSRRSPTKFEGTRSSPTSSSPCRGRPKDGKAFPSGKHVALTHWSAGGDPTDVTKQQGVWQYCADPSGAVVQNFMKDYPYTDSPEPQAM